MHRAMTDILLPTSLVGSYAQPEWLIGEQRRDSYSNRFATALEGVDINNPGTALDRSGHPNPVPRIVSKIRRKQPVEVRMEGHLSILSNIPQTP